jgi:hypothetical protein
VPCWAWLSIWICGNTNDPCHTKNKVIIEFLWNNHRHNDDGQSFFNVHINSFSSIKREISLDESTAYAYWRTFFFDHGYTIESECTKIHRAMRIHHFVFFCQYMCFKCQKASVLWFAVCRLSTDSSIPRGKWLALIAVVLFSDDDVQLNEGERNWSLSGLLVNQVFSFVRSFVC